MKNYFTTTLLMALLSLPVVAQNSGSGPGNTDAQQIILTVMPNPVKNGIVIFKMEGLKKKTYLAKIFSDKGAIIAVEKINSPTSTSFKMLQLEKKFKGYGRVLLQEDNGRVVAQSKFLVLDN